MHALTGPGNGSPMVRNVVVVVVVIVVVLSDILFPKALSFLN